MTFDTFVLSFMSSLWPHVDGAAVCRCKRHLYQNVSQYITLILDFKTDKFLTLFKQNSNMLGTVRVAILLKFCVHLQLFCVPIIGITLYQNIAMQFPFFPCHNLLSRLTNFDLLVSDFSCRSLLPSGLTLPSMVWHYTAARYLAPLIDS